jgi:hypothetical protein
MFDHGIHGGLAHESTMFNGNHSGLYGSAHTFISVGVGGNIYAKVTGGGDDHRQLVRTIMGQATIACERQYTTCGAHFDAVCPAFYLSTHGSTALIGAIGDAHFRYGWVKKIPSTAGGSVTVPACDAEGSASGKDARPYDPAVVDRVSQGNIDACSA